MSITYVCCVCFFHQSNVYNIGILGSFHEGIVMSIFPTHMICGSRARCIHTVGLLNIHVVYHRYPMAAAAIMY